MMAFRESARWLIGGLFLSGIAVGAPAAEAPSYRPIDPTMASQTVTLTGHDLTIDQVVAVARYGAKVQVSPEAAQREADTFGLMMEGATEGMPIYLFNRGAGSGRQIATFEGDPLSPTNRPVLEERVLRQFQNGANNGTGPEVDAEELIRANMVVRANTMTYLAASPQLLQGLVDLLNHRVTPVARTLGGTGEADGPIVGNVNGVLVGRGEAYVDGQRMKAADALAKVGLKPIAPAPGDGTVSTTNADFAGQAALLVADAHQLLDWADLVYTMDLEAMNSSVTPLFRNVQDNRPYPWLNWQAARALEMIKGSYLFNDDPTRIIQDPESLRASAIRQGATWLAWSRLKDTVTTAINYSDHNPAVSIDYGPTTAWELATPQAMKYYVKGGPESHGKHGYVFSNANWDPYPLDNDIEAFTNALANMDIVVVLREDRFSNTFFTVIKPADAVKDLATTPGVLRPSNYAPLGDTKTMTALWQEIQGLAMPVAPSGLAIVSTVEDLQANTQIKVGRARQAVNDSFDLLGQDLLTAAFWMDVRKAQDPARDFGPGPTAAWTAFRQILPFKLDETDVTQPPSVLALTFLKANPATKFFSGGPPMPADDDTKQREKTRK
jgi:histidine ammonia-lyase